MSILQRHGIWFEISCSRTNPHIIEGITKYQPNKKTKFYAQQN